MTGILNGQIIGKKLPNDSKSEKTPTASLKTPELCLHAADRMMKGGNKNTKWWTCKDCLTRWERQPIGDRSGPPLPTDLMMFGKYPTETYEKVYRDHGRYALWLQASVDYETPSSAHLRFVSYCQMAQTASTTNARGSDSGFAVVGETLFETRNYPR